MNRLTGGGQSVTLVVPSVGLHRVVGAQIGSLGFLTRTAEIDAAVADLCSGAPEAVVVVEVSVGSTSLELVERLRVLPETSVLSLIVLITTESVRLQAQEHGNVQQVIRVPTTAPVLGEMNG